MNQRFCSWFTFLLSMLIILLLALPATAVEKFWGSYKKKQDGHSMSLSLQPVGGNEKSDKAIVMIDYIENSGIDLEIDGVGDRKSNTVTLYSRYYKVTVTVKNGVANLKFEESCGNHRFYEGYGYYSDTCSLGSYKALAAMSQDVKPRK